MQHFMQDVFRYILGKEVGHFSFLRRFRKGEVPEGKKAAGHGRKNKRHFLDHHIRFEREEGIADIGGKERQRESDPYEEAVRKKDHERGQERAQDHGNHGYPTVGRPEKIVHQIITGKGDVKNNTGRACGKRRRFEV